MGKRKRYRFSVELPQDVYLNVKTRATEKSIPVTEQLRRQLKLGLWLDEALQEADESDLYIKKDGQMERIIVLI